MLEIDCNWPVSGDEPSRFRFLLDEVDLLIDGEFRVEAIGNHRWRVSSNQRLLCLTDRIKLPPEEATSEMQLTFQGQGTGFSLSGIWPPGIMQELIRQLRLRGFSMERDLSALEHEQKAGGS